MQKCRSGNGTRVRAGAVGRVAGDPAGPPAPVTSSAMTKVTRSGGGGGGQILFTLNVSGLPSHLSNVQFFSERLIAVWSRQYISTKLVL